MTEKIKKSSTKTQKTNTSKTQDKKTQDCLIIINKDSDVKLTKTSGELQTLNMTTGSIVKLKFKKASMLYKLLDGRSLMKDLYKKDRLVAIQIDEKGYSDSLKDAELKTFEKKSKISKYHWTLVHKGSFGI